MKVGISVKGVRTERDLEERIVRSCKKIPIA